MNKLAEDSQGFAGSLNKLVSTSLTKPARPIRKGYQKGVPAAEGRRQSLLEAAKGRLPLRMCLVETSLSRQVCSNSRGIPGNLPQACSDLSVTYYVDQFIKIFLAIISGREQTNKKARRIAETDIFVTTITKQDSAI